MVEAVEGLTLDIADELSEIKGQSFALPAASMHGRPVEIALRAVITVVAVTVGRTGVAVLSTISVVMEGSGCDSVDRTVMVGTGAVTVTTWGEVFVLLVDTTEVVFVDVLTSLPAVPSVSEEEVGVAVTVIVASC